MDNLYDILNIKKIDIEQGIKDSIKTTKEELKEIPTKQNCFKYSKYLKHNLNKLNIVSRLIDTNSLGIDYEHYFVMVPKNSDTYYVIDLTYAQFGNDSYFNDLYTNGYELMDNVKFNAYLKRLSKEYSFIPIDDAYHIKR